MSTPDTRFLATQQERLRQEAGALVDNLTNLREEDFDRAAASILARWEATQGTRRARDETMVQRVFTPDEVAEHMKVKASTIREWLRSGHLKGFKIGGKEWRVSEVDLEAFIERLRSEPVTPEE